MAESAYTEQIQAILRFFAYAHLPERLRDVSEPFCALATQVAAGPHNDETVMALRKLLEAKDCAVRATL